MQTFSTQLKKHRENLELSQEQLADKLHIARQSISKWERGESYPSIGALIRLSDTLGVPVDKLLKGDHTLKEKIIKDGQSSRYPKLKLSFDLLFAFGVVILAIKLVIFIYAKVSHVEIDLLQHQVFVIAPMVLMVVGGIGSDALKKSQ